MVHDFGQRLVTLRQARGLTRYAVWKATGIPQPILGRLEHLSYGGDVRARTIHTLAKFYGVSMEYLVEEGNTTDPGRKPQDAA